jgi:hypothetical protein
MSEQTTAEYFNLGWRPVPLEGKKPYLPNWEKLSLIKEEFEATIREGDNVGLITGRLNDKFGLVAIDVDQPDLIGFRPDSFLNKGSMAHTTSTGLRLVFYTDSGEVYAFSRKVQKRADELAEEERQRLNNKAKGKEAVVIIEILAQGRQFMAPPSKHPKTGAMLKWVVAPKPPEETLIIHSLNELKELLSQAITQNKWVLDDLFEISKSETSQDTAVLQAWLNTVKEKLDFAGETQNYLMFHCPFHKPDNNPSFVIHKSKFYGQDYHDDRTYNLKALAKQLNIELENTKKRTFK